MGDGGWFVAVAASSAFCILVFIIILFMTKSPPAPVDGEQLQRSGLKEAVLNLDFIAVSAPHSMQQTRTIFQHDGPNRLGFSSIRPRSRVLSAHKRAASLWS